MKDGELEGVRQLAPDVAACVLPRFIVPPRSERVGSELLPLGALETPDISPPLAGHWRDRPVLIDASYLLDEFGRDRMPGWFPQMFGRARDRLVQAIPMALLGDIRAREAPALRAAIANDSNFKFAVCVPSGEMVGPEFFVEMRQALDRLGLAPAECVVIVDFAGSDFSNPEIVAPIIGGALESLQEFGSWHRIIFQGTSFPETNSVAPGSQALWMRGEWLAWHAAVRFDPSTAEHMVFGDYAADSAKMEFGSSGGRAIRHLRYTAGTKWLVQRGAAERSADKHIMAAVCRAIVASGHFAGAEFSAADAYILRTALGQDGPGNASTWRQLNTTHHITQVVADIAAVRGLVITKSLAPPAQLTLEV